MLQDPMPVSRMVLVRHARPVIDPNTSPELWELKAGAEDDVKRLAKAIRTVGCDGVVVSPELKARRTGEILARCLELPVMIDPAFIEQGGGRVPWLPDRAFLAAVEEHFAHGDRVVFGTETSHQAAARFASGIEHASAGTTCPVVVTHGRVMCGYVANMIGVDPVPIWRSLRLPDAFIMDLSARTFRRIDARKPWREG